MLEVAVIQAGLDNVVCCFLGVGDRNLACVAGYLEVAVFYHFLDPGSEGFCGLPRELIVGDWNLAFVAVFFLFLDTGSEGFQWLLRELLVLLETNRVVGWMEDRDR